jgi:hypothetical protein
MKTIRLTAHAVEQSAERGATEDEVRGAIERGLREPAKRGRSLCRLNFQYQASGKRSFMPSNRLRRWSSKRRMK